jgi:FecR protein
MDSGVGYGSAATGPAIRAAGSPIAGGRRRVGVESASAGDADQEIRMMGRLWRLAALQVILLAGAAHLQAANAAGKIGVTSAAQNQVEGVQGGTTQPLAAGSQIFQDEIIKTGVKSMAQLLFLDETSLSVGPLSEVTLDTFVFNPATGSGDVVFSATKGAFRFITGSQDPTNYQIKTAVATIGVRGTIVDWKLLDNGALYLVAQEGKANGAVFVVVDGVTYVLKPGQALFVAANKTVTGPMAPDDEFFHVVGAAPFPLWAGQLPGEHQQIEVPDDGTVRSDDLFEHENPCDSGYNDVVDPTLPVVVPVVYCSDY